jgi:hypothetical protein
LDVYVAVNTCSVEVPPTPVFSPDRLHEILSGVFALRGHWKERSPGFYSLGFAHYIEGREGSLDSAEVAESNARLRDTFAPALDELVAFLARELDAPVEYGAGLPLPGFHIVEPAAMHPGRPVGDSHFDLQYTFGDFPAPVLATLSFTIPIQLPAAGASLEHWPVDFEEIRRLIDAGEIADIAGAERRFAMETVAYEPGKACLQYGLPLHRMGAISHVEPTDRRVTLQGHAALVGEGWIAYW